jgi:hypothetical protein
MITPPSSGEDVRQLWRKVAECVDALNALQNMTCKVEGQVTMEGRLEGNVLKIKEAKEIRS